MARMRGQQARPRAAQAMTDEERRQALFQELLNRGLDPAQAELALVNPEFARVFMPEAQMRGQVRIEGVGVRNEGLPMHDGARVPSGLAREDPEPDLEAQGRLDHGPFDPAPSKSGTSSREFPSAQGSVRANRVEGASGSVDTRGLRSTDEPAEAVGRRIGEEIPGLVKPAAAPHDHAAEERDFRAKLGAEGLNRFGYIPGETDVNLLARALYSEFGQIGSWEDMRAGAWTIINRIRPAAGRPGHRARFELAANLPDVLSRRGPGGTPQYSFMPAGGVAAPGGSPGWRQSATPQRLTGNNRKAWELAVMTAQDVLGGSVPDPTGGATAFHNQSMGVPPDARGWFGRALDRTIALSPYSSPTGQNYFYRVLEDPLQPVISKPGLGHSPGR